MNRWLALFSRIGTALVAIGLALLLVSLIPSGGSTVNQEFTQTLSPLTFFPTFGQPLTPQQTASFSVKSDSLVNIYILKVSEPFLYAWIYNNSRTPFNSNNVTYLKSFLGNFSQAIAYSQNSVKSFSYQYNPTAVTNVTLVVSNPTTTQATVKSNSSISFQVAPASRVATLADWSIPIGLVLAIPWVIDLYNRKFRKSTPELGTQG